MYIEIQEIAHINNLPSFNYNSSQKIVPYQMQ